MRKLILALATLTTVFSLTAAPVFAYDPFQNVCNTNDSQNSSLCQGQGNSTENPLTGPNGLLRGITGIIALLAGIAAVITIIMAGLRYITSGGDAGKAKSAKDTILFAVVGLVVIILAESIISLVISKL